MRANPLSEAIFLSCTSLLVPVPTYISTCLLCQQPKAAMVFSDTGCVDLFYGERWVFGAYIQINVKQQL